MPGACLPCTASASMLVARDRMPGAGRRGPAPPSAIEILNRDTYIPGASSAVASGAKVRSAWTPRSRSSRWPSASERHVRWSMFARWRGGCAVGSDWLAGDRRPSGRRNTCAPSPGARVTVKPPSWISRWWWRQSWTRFAQPGRAAVGPVLDVMRVDESGRGAAGEAAAAVAGRQGALQRGRDRAGLAPDVERVALALDDADDRPVAGEPACGLRCERDAADELAAPGFVRGGERGGLDVDHDLMAVTARARAWPGGEERLREREQCVGALLAACALDAGDVFRRESV